MLTNWCREVRQQRVLGARNPRSHTDLVSRRSEACRKQSTLTHLVRHASAIATAGNRQLSLLLHCRSIDSRLPLPLPTGSVASTIGRSQGLAGCKKCFGASFKSGCTQQSG